MKACEHFTRRQWRCGKCEGANVPLHSRHCSKRETCGDCSVFDRLDRERICQRAECNLSRLDPACPAFVRSPAAEKGVTK